MAWLYLIALVGAWVVMRRWDERGWPISLLLLGPRWVLGAPLVIVTLAARRAMRQVRWPVAAAWIFLAVPLMGLRCNVPLRGSPATSLRLRVLTLNAHGSALDGLAMRRVLRDVDPDVVALQEYEPDYGGRLFEDDGGHRWHVVSRGPVCLASRYPVRMIGNLYGRPLVGNDVQGVDFAVETPAGEVRIVNVRLESPHPALSGLLRGAPGSLEALERNARLRRNQAAALAGYASALPGCVLLAGDFNSAAESSVLRKNLAPFRDAFSDRGLGYGWTYKSGGAAIRLDHIYYRGASVDCGACWVGPDVGSPHRPLVADLYLNGLQAKGK